MPPHGAVGIRLISIFPRACIVLARTRLVVLGVALQGTHNFLSRLCADEMNLPTFVPNRDDVAGGSVLQRANARAKARRAPAARAVVVPQDQIHHVCVVVEQVVETLAEHDARVPVPGCTARGAVARARRQVAGLWCRGTGGSCRGGRGGVLPSSIRCAPTAAALRGPPLKARGAGEFRTALNTHTARHCAARAVLCRWVDDETEQAPSRSACLPLVPSGVRRRIKSFRGNFFGRGTSRRVRLRTSRRSGEHTVRTKAHIPPHSPRLGYVSLPSRNAPCMRCAAA